MSNPTSILVRKPQIAFSQRLKDSHITKLTTNQLHEKAHQQNLDVSRLNNRWEIVHSLVETCINGTIPQPYIQNVVDDSRWKVFKFPSEIRNQTYSYVLCEEEPLIARYGTSYLSHILEPSAMRTHIPIPSSVQQLMNMSRANRKLYGEARGYFFSHNIFDIHGSDEDSFVTFLTKIGTVG
jgi:hypothetical protein